MTTTNQITGIAQRGLKKRSSDPVEGLSLPRTENDGHTAPLSPGEGQRVRRERPMLMSTLMVQAILAGQKTQTRRVLKPTPWQCPQEPSEYWIDTPKKNFPSEAVFVSNDNDAMLALCPYGQPGDIIWVRETWASPINAWHPFFKADNDPENRGNIWRPSIHMPKDAARIWLQLESIRVERLQQITEDDAIAEGIIEFEDGTYQNYFTQKGLRECDGVECLLAKGSYQSLWCKINGIKSWNSNPYVWVITFKVLSTNGKPSNLN
jgi:hypothetical protein